MTNLRQTLLIVAMCTSVLGCKKEEAPVPAPVPEKKAKVKAPVAAEPEAEPEAEAPKKATTTPDEHKCKAGNSASCALAGRARIDAEEYALARPLLEKGCKHGSAEACDDLGWIYDDGLGIDVDKLKAEEFYGKACTGNFARGCTNQGVMYLSGEGVEKDSKKAVTLFTKATVRSPVPAGAVTWRACASRNGVTVASPVAYTVSA